MRRFIVWMDREESDGKRVYSRVLVNDHPVFSAQTYGTGERSEEARDVAKELKVALEELATMPAAAQALMDELRAHQREVEDLRQALYQLLVKAGAAPDCGPAPLTNSAMFTLVADFKPKEKACASSSSSPQT